MNTPKLSLGMAGLGFGALLVLMTPAQADTVSFKASLSGAAEVPPADTKASGTLTATYDTSTKQLSYTVDYSGLSGPATGAHFHGPADAGQNAGVAVPLAAPLTSPVKGAATLNDAQANDLMAGKWYLNIHTATNKGGEIRGQLEKAK